VSALLGTSPDAVLGKSIEVVLGKQQFEIFRSRLRSDDLAPASSLRVSIGKPAVAMNCVAHRCDGVLIVECEVVKGAHWVEAAELSANIQILLERMERATTILDYCRVAGSEIARLSGFDRVMIYQFDAEFNGEVVAETGGVAEPGSTVNLKYLGLRFPSTDMPAQARELFLANPLRAIADVESAQVPITPEIGSHTGRPLDMTHTFLRSASAVHLEYLRNMGVRASMAISIVFKGRLWGMVACHHHTPRHVDCSTRAICEMIARNLALQMSIRNADAAQRSQLASRELLEDFADDLEDSGGCVDAPSLGGPRFLELFDADGLVSYLGGVVASQGVSAPHPALLPVIERLKKLAVRGIASSEKLSALDPGAESYRSEASGALYIGINERTGEYLLFLRRELVETVRWAGNPDKAVNTDAAGTLHPRASFAAWLETAHGRARPWTEPELDSARGLRAQVRHSQDVQKLRAMEERLT
jgi:light-regulated signal transduction histidine kinase (bacteriophytochrome)